MSLKDNGYFSMAEKSSYTTQQSSAAAMAMVVETARLADAQERTAAAQERIANAAEVANLIALYTSDIPHSRVDYNAVWESIESKGLGKE